MSGHSKWSTIKRKKGAADAKRGKIFTVIIKEITIAARMGGGDENSNPRLRQAVIKAKANNMPADNIKRAIQKGTGELPGISYEEYTYEGYGPGGVAVFLEVMTDNKNRTVADVRHLMVKFGGNLGENGSVAWMFNKKGQIRVPNTAGEEDEILDIALESGATDFETEDDMFLISTDPTDMFEVKEALEAKQIPIDSAEIEMVPKNLQKVEGKDAEKTLKLMDALEDHDDISQVYSNFDIDEDSLTED